MSRQLRPPPHQDLHVRLFCDKLPNYMYIVANFINLKNRISSIQFSRPMPMHGFWMKHLLLREVLAGTYEPETTKLFERIIKPGWTVIDVGAEYAYFCERDYCGI
jgi:hypothetical protein